MLGNVTGGSQRGVAYDGLTQMALQLDTARAFGLHGGTFNVSALQIHGQNLSADNLLSLQTASGIEADRATRLWELWYQQKFLEEDRLDLKVGQQSLDQEFMVKPTRLLRQHHVRLANGAVGDCRAAARPIRCRRSACARGIGQSIQLHCWEGCSTAARHRRETAMLLRRSSAAEPVRERIFR